MSRKLINLSVIAAGLAMGASAQAAVIFSDNFDSDPLNKPYGFGTANPATYTTTDNVVHAFPTFAGSKWQEEIGFVDLLDHNDADFHAVFGTDPDPTGAHQHFVDLNGVLTNGPRDANGQQHGDAGPGEILNKTGMVLPAGTYQLSFQLAGSHRIGTSGIGDSAEILNLQVYDATNPSAHTVFFLDPTHTVINVTLDKNTDWTTFTYTFTADHAYSNVFMKFEDGGNGNSDSDGYGLLLDNVNLQSVPEPASLSMLGLGAAGLLRRRRKA